MRTSPTLGIAAMAVGLTALVVWMASIPALDRPSVAAAAPAQPHATGREAPTMEVGPRAAVDWPAGLPREATTPEEVRTVVGFCREAEAGLVPGLRLAALEAQDPLVAGNALRALGRLGAVADDEALDALLEDPRPRIRQEAVIALGRSGSAGAVDRLAPLLDEDDTTLRHLAIQALGRLGGERANGLLLRALKAPEVEDGDRAFLREALRDRSATAGG